MRTSSDSDGLSHGRRESGFTLVEVMASVVILILILAAGMSLLQTGTQLTATSTYQSTSMVRVSRVLERCSESLRRAEGDSMLHPADGTTFDSGESGPGFTVDEVTGYGAGGSTTSTVTIQWNGTAGTPGDVTRSAGGVLTVIATEVTNFAVRRSGRLLTVTVSSTEGPGDDRDRTATGTIQIVPRNQ